ncbi:MarR family transcriptional regulator [Streptomyces sp. SID3343]|uniref:MarR family transcriptional regulator n=1 Tax=Streptomyces sp. SID3343 TaxID=2690260 RepID=UPI00136BE4D1|nr:MarR family transcriptional regulator [Streptomyces sp. SID3343]
MATAAAELLETLLGRASTAPVSTSQLRALFLLEQHDGINLRTLADGLGSTPSSTSRLCDRLDAVGFVERLPSANSRRELQLRLSGRGRAFLVDLRARREREMAVVIARMPVESRAMLLTGLESLRSATASLAAEAADAARGPQARTA